MSRRKSVAELEELLKIKRAQLAARAEHKTANPSPYVARPDEDYTSLFYLDPLDNERELQVRVGNLTLAAWGGVAKTGLSGAATAGKAVVEIGRGSKIAIVKVRWYFGDETPIPVAANAMHGRWIKFYDKKGGQSFHQIPFVASGLTPDLHATIVAFKAKLNTAGEKTELLGAKGRAELVIGYGNNYTVLARESA
ncbi:MAG: hypothetical protein V7K27_00220 [Nostoc sp.]|uniref:hypothetical protein n=1 Tax=Nostoc sp. TaxID=1180 RepID=UPI002FFA00E2